MTTLEQKLAVEKLATTMIDALLGTMAEGEVAKLIDWPRFRLMQLMQGSAGVDAAMREQLIARGLVELARAKLGADVEERAVRSLRALMQILLPRGWRFVDDFANPLLSGLRGGPAANAPHALKHYLTMLQELSQTAEDVTIAALDDVHGQKLMTLLFVAGKYVGFLPGAQQHH
jgi:hypothetical protein